MCWGQEGVKSLCIYFIMCVRQKFLVTFLVPFSLLSTWLRIFLFVLHTWCVVGQPKIAWQ